MGQASQRDFGAASGRSRQAAPLAGEGEASRARRGDCSEHCLEAGVSFSRSTGYELMRIARQFDAEIAKGYGVEKLELGLSGDGDDLPAFVAACERQFKLAKK